MTSNPENRPMENAKTEQAPCYATLRWDDEEQFEHLDQPESDNEEFGRAWDANEDEKRPERRRLKRWERRQRREAREQAEAAAARAQPTSEAPNEQPSHEAGLNLTRKASVISPTCARLMRGRSAQVSPPRRSIVGSPPEPAFCLRRLGDFLQGWIIDSGAFTSASLTALEATRPTLASDLKGFFCANENGRVKRAQIISAGKSRRRPARRRTQ
jgi:hypothetical protein